MYLANIEKVINLDTKYLTKAKVFYKEEFKNINRVKKVLSHLYILDLVQKRMLIMLASAAYKDIENGANLFEVKSRLDKIADKTILKLAKTKSQYISLYSEMEILKDDLETINEIKSSYDEDLTAYQVDAKSEKRLNLSDENQENIETGEDLTKIKKFILMTDAIDSPYSKNEIIESYYNKYKDEFKTLGVKYLILELSYTDYSNRINSLGAVSERIIDSFIDKVDDSVSVKEMISLILSCKNEYIKNSLLRKYYTVNRMNLTLTDLQSLSESVASTDYQNRTNSQGVARQYMVLDYLRLDESKDINRVNIILNLIGSSSSENMYREEYFKNNISLFDLDSMEF